jgi:hypothetical protein
VATVNTDLFLQQPSMECRYLVVRGVSVVRGISEANLFVGKRILPLGGEILCSPLGGEILCSFRNCASNLKAQLSQ